jgi:hypothetical protein
MAAPGVKKWTSSHKQSAGTGHGVSFYNIPVTDKRLALLHELVPRAEVIAVLQSRHLQCTNPCPLYPQ